MAFEQSSQTKLVIFLILAGHKENIIRPCCVGGPLSGFEKSTLEIEAMDCRNLLNKFVIWTRV